MRYQASFSDTELEIGSDHPEIKPEGLPPPAICCHTASWRRSALSSSLPDCLADEQVIL